MNFKGRLGFAGSSAPALFRRRRRELRMRQIRLAAPERHRQLCRGIHFAEQNVRDRIGALAAGVPRLQNPAHGVEPRHGDRGTGVLEAWYTGSQGADAVANILFGEVNPTAKLPMTFPRSEADLPHPQLATPPPEERGRRRSGEAKPTFEVHYEIGRASCRERV